ncbi:MAG: WXG100 family type VII secretion target [Mogibacterium sp.]|nr:WXG100 family type VII secretion target [Mogibacterium sp.]
MSKVIRVSADKMKRDRSRIDTKIDDMQADVNKLADAMRDLATCWEGPAWSSFQNSVNESMKEMDEVCRFLSNYLSDLSKAESLYRQCENDNRNNIRRVRI